jgi:O-antigen/teichoic acid export membrane protein
LPRLSRLEPRAVLPLLIGGGMTRAVSAVGALLLARLYGPESLGLYGYYGIIVMLGSAVAAGQYENALVTETDDRSAWRLMRATLGMSLAGSALLALLIGGLHGHLEKWLGAPGLGSLVLLAPLSILGQKIFRILLFWNTRAGAFRIQALCSWWLTVAMLGVQFGAGLAFDISPLWLALGDVTGIWVGVGVLCWRSASLAAPAVPLLGDGPITALLVRWRQYPLLNMPSSLCVSAASQVPLLALGTLLSVEAAGQVALAMRILELPRSLVGDSVSTVFSHRMSANMKDGEPTSPVLRSTLGLLSRLGAPIYVAAAIAAPYVMPVVFASRWDKAGMYITILAPLYFFMTMASAVTPVFSFVRREGIGLSLHLASILAAALAAAFGHIADSAMVFLVSFVALSSLRCLVLLFVASRLTSSLHSEQLP